MPAATHCMVPAFLGADAGAMHFLYHGQTARRSADRRPLRWTPPRGGG